MKLHEVSKVYQGFALKKITLDIEAGEFFVILGPSGAGKTLILEIIAGLLQPDSGVVSGAENLRKGFIYQDYMLFPHLKVFDNIAYGLTINKQEKNEVARVVAEISGKLEIDHLLNRGIVDLSGGEKQRVAIARAMAISPDIYLLDEPTAALDRNLRLLTRKLFVDLHKQTGATFIHVTHDFEEALALGDRIAVLMDGEVVQCNRPDDLFNSPKNRQVADFLGYRNVYGGAVSSQVMKIQGVDVSVPLKSANFAYIAIRADDIILSAKQIDSSARNSFQGKVTGIMPKASVVEIILDVGFSLSIDITRKSFEELGVSEGDTLWATFKVSAIKVFEH